jgi:hypothetical protein
MGKLPEHSFDLIAKVNKMPKTKASKRIELRVTDEFFQDLNSKIEDSGLSKADYFRH